MPMLPAAVAAMLSSLAFATSAADGCETLRAEIDARIRAAGVEVFSLAIVDAAAEVPGEVVGSCGQRSRKIVYLKGVRPPASAAAGGAPATPGNRPAAGRPAGETMVTECKSGFVAIRGGCMKL